MSVADLTGGTERCGGGRKPNFCEVSNGLLGVCHMSKNGWCMFEDSEAPPHSFKIIELNTCSYFFVTQQMRQVDASRRIDSFMSPPALRLLQARDAEGKPAAAADVISASSFKNKRRLHIARISSKSSGTCPADDPPLLHPVHPSRAPE